LILIQGVVVFTGGGDGCGGGEAPERPSQNCQILWQFIKCGVSPTRITLLQVLGAFWNIALHCTHLKASNQRQHLPGKQGK
jgi:hypothetical protein